MLFPSPSVKERNMKKRIVLSGLLAAALTLSLTACGGDKMP